MKAQKRNPEQWEPQEFIGKFANSWYYFGTYSIANEPVFMTKEEFLQLSRKASRFYHPVLLKDDAVHPRTRKRSLPTTGSVKSTLSLTVCRRSSLGLSGGH